MEGHKELTMDGKAPITWAFTPSHDASDPRLAETLHVRTAA